MPARRPPALLDALTGLGVLVAWALAILALTSRGWYPSYVATYWWTGLFLALAVALRRSRPLLGFWLVLLGVVLTQRAGLQTYFQVLPIAVAAFAVVRGGALTWWRALPVAMAAGAMFGVWGILPGSWLTSVAVTPELQRIIPGSDFPLWYVSDLSEQAQVQAIIVTAVLLGHVFHRLDLTRRDLEERNAQLLALQHAEADRAVTAERNRIAREMHDVVAHHVTAIVVRSQAALHVAPRQPQAAPEALHWIVGEGKEALTAMRSMVRILRVDAGEAPTAEPLLTLLHATVDRVTSGGREVTLEAPADLRPLGRDVELAVVRIVQEALTNVALHSAAPGARVRLGLADGALLLDVVDPGPALTPTTEVPTAGGNGLGHMQERAASVGGRLAAGPHHTGWRVVAEIPVRVTTSGSAE